MHYKRGFQYIGGLSLIAVAVWAVTYHSTAITYVAHHTSVSERVATGIAAVVAPLRQSVDFTEDFEKNVVVEEAASLRKSKNKNWWVSSGAYFLIEDGVGKTLQGSLERKDRWFSLYENSNSQDTAGGYRPQNIFRLVFKGVVENPIQEVYARIKKHDPSDSEFRNESNGVLLFNRYQDMNTLYYVGIRVDGKAVVKKKLNGEYSTLGLVSVITGDKPFNENTNPNILPLDTWFGIRSTVETLPDGTALIELFVDRNRIGNWQKVLSVVDDGITHGPVIAESGYGGIRTDFMDVEFDDYSIKEMGL